MLPQIRQEEGLYPVPQVPVEKIDIEGFIDELKGFHGAFADCFSRSEPRENFGKYMTGQSARSERKTMEPIAFHIGGCDPGCMQYMISDALRNEEKMPRKYHKPVSEDMGEPDGVVISDEPGFPRKGEESAGVPGAVLRKFGESWKLSGGSFCGLCIFAGVCFFG